MLYFKALREGLADLPQADPETARRRSTPKPRLRGWPALHAELARLDPETAARLAPNDAQRIQRALEVVRAHRPAAGRVLRPADQPQPLPYRLLAAGAACPPTARVLHERIAERFDAMLDAGLVDEVEACARNTNSTPTCPRCAASATARSGKCSKALPAAELRDRGIFATRQFAKRQLTWLRATPDLVLLDSLDADAADQALRAVDDLLRST